MWTTSITYLSNLPSFWACSLPQPHPQLVASILSNSPCLMIGVPSSSKPSMYIILTGSKLRGEQQGAGREYVPRWCNFYDKISEDITPSDEYLHILSGPHQGWISWQGGWQGCSGPGRRCTGSCWGTTQSPTLYQWGSLLFYWDSKKSLLHYKDHQPPPS